MLPRWLWIALGAVLAGAVVVWMVSAAPPPEEPMAVPEREAEGLDRPAARALALDGAAVDQATFGKVSNLDAALRRQRVAVNECLTLARLHDDLGDTIDLSATYVPRDDGRFDVRVTATDLGDITFDRCMNAILEPMSLASDAQGTVALDAR